MIRGFMAFIWSMRRLAESWVGITYVRGSEKALFQKLFM